MADHIGIKEFNLIIKIKLKIMKQFMKEIKRNINIVN